MSIYIFDIDHTLLKGATGIFFIKEGLDRKVFKIIELLRIPIVLFKYRMGFLKGSIVENRVPFMHGLSRKTVEELGEKGFENHGRNKVYKEAEALIKSLQEKNEKIIFATSSFNYSVQSVARYFGVDTVISSAFEFENDVCTGFIEGRTAFGDSKKNKVLAYLKDHNIQAEDCIFYSDSHHDTPLLEAVGRPICVNPDRKLKALARQKNWEILRFKETVPDNPKA